MSLRLKCFLSLAVIIASIPAATHAQESMDKLWGDAVVKLRAENAERGQLFDAGNYAMFIHGRLYSLLGNEVDWTVISVPPNAPEPLVSVIQVDLESEPDVDPVWALDPDF